MHDRWLRNLSFGLAVILSLVVLFKPGSDGPLPFPQADKLIHATTFALLAITAWWRLRSWTVIAGILVGYAAGSEVIQHFFIRGREFDLLDIAADLAGTFVILVPVRDKK
jgi:hypothetical protein